MESDFACRIFPMARRAKRNKQLIPSIPMPSVSTSTKPAENESRPIVVTLNAPNDIVSRYENVANDLVCRRRLVYEVFMKCEAAQRIISAIAENIASRNVGLRLLQNTPVAIEAKRRVENAILWSGGHTILGWQNTIKSLLRSMFGSVTGAFIPFQEDPLGRVISFKVLDPLLPFPFWDSQKQEELVRIYGYSSDRNYNEATGIWFTDGGRWSKNAYQLDQSQYVQMVDSAFGVGAFASGVPMAELSLVSMVLHISLMDTLRYGANANDPAQLVVLNNVDYNRLQKALTERQDAIAARLRGEQVEESKVKSRILVTNSTPQINADVKSVNLRSYPEGFNIQQLLSQVEETIGLNFGVNRSRVAGGIESARFGNATNVALLNADEPGMRFAESCVNELLRWVIGDDSKYIQVEFSGIDNAKNTLEVKYELDVAQTASQLLSVMGQDGARRYVESKRIVPSPAKVEPEERKKEFDQDYVRCTLKATARWQDWIANELPNVVDGLGLNRTELQSEVRDIAVEINNEMVRCAMRAANQNRSTRLRLYFDQLRNRWLTLIGVPSQRGDDTQFPKRNMYRDMVNLAPQIASGRADAATLQRIAEGYTHHIERYFLSASGAEFILRYPPDYDKPVAWVLDEVAKHCDDCPRLAGRYPNMRALLQASGNRYPRSLDLQCAGNCHCSIREVK